MNKKLNCVFATFTVMLMMLLCVSVALNAGNDNNGDSNLEEIEAEVEEDVEGNVEVVPATTSHFVLDEMEVIAHHEVHSHHSAHKTVDEIDEIHEPVLFNEAGEPNCSTTYVVGSDDLSSH